MGKDNSRPEALSDQHPREIQGARASLRAGVSPVSDATWLFHLDEETHITPSVIRGIHSAVVEEERTGELRIGQGVVLYHRDLDKHPFLTLADSVRTETILVAFVCNTFLAKAHSACTDPSSWCAMTSKRGGIRPRSRGIGHRGRLVVTRGDGARAPVAVDRWLLPRAVDASVMDFLKQRRRWFVGLCLVCLKAPARMWHRVTLVSSIVLWGVGWLGWWSISIAPSWSTPASLGVLFVEWPRWPPTPPLPLGARAQPRPEKRGVVPPRAVAPGADPPPSHLFPTRSAAVVYA